MFAITALILKTGLEHDEVGADFSAWMQARELACTRLMGTWDHFYPDSAYYPAVSTHYVNLQHWLDLSAEEAAALTLPQGPDQQHARWQ